MITIISIIVMTVILAGILRNDSIDEKITERRDIDKKKLLREGIFKW
jgi:hypothetical protein